ncbi:MAG: DUF1501 domain-containing protein, partial [Planctomycetia bacterium]|nr:DUF1501 domain-containing protein [Planctomycetia bacterium]
MTQQQTTPQPVTTTLSRRQWLGSFGMGLGGLALAEILGSTGQAASTPGVLKTLHHAPKAKRVIYLFQSGGPSQLDLFDHKPLLLEQTGQQLPDSVR